MAGADVVLESFAPGHLASLGLGYEALQRVRPGLVLTSVTPFGQDGPYAGLAGEEIVFYAMGGPMHATGIEGREPLKMAGNLIQYQCGSVAALATTAALEVAEADGQGCHVDVNNLETQVGSIDRRTTYLLYHSFTGRVATRQAGNVQSAIPAGLFPTSDGYVQILTIPSWAPRMLEVLGDGDLVRRFAEPGWMVDPDLPDEVEARLYPWLLERTKAGASADAQSLRWPITPLNQPLDVVDDPHFAARGFWAEVDHPATGGHLQPGPPFRLGGEAGSGWELRRPAPLLGQHQGEIEAEARAAAPATPAAPAPAPVAPAPAVAAPAGPAASPGGPRSTRRLPLEGVRVLDLTVVWAGPYGTMLLGDLGAEVIRVDNPWLFPTATRGHLPRPPAAMVPEMGPLSAYPDDDPGARPWNRHSMYSAHARNKLGATVDLRREEGREVFLRLVERSDVVVENNSARVLDQLGLGWDVLHARNPGLVAVRLPPMGLDGPYRDWLGFGAHFEALCGLSALRGYPDLDPTSLAPVFHMDPATGVACAFATLLALRQRRRTGLGQLVELPQSENLVQHIGEYLVDASRTRREHRSVGNRHPTRAPQGCYPCAVPPGDPPPADGTAGEAWAVLSVGSDEEWAGLVRALGEPAWATGERFAAAAGRRAHHDELDEHLVAWTSQLTPYEVFRRCQAEGVPAAPVLDERGCYAEPHLDARGFFRENGSEDLGRHRFPGHLWRWDGPTCAGSPLPASAATTSTSTARYSA
ncbi:MAG: hypothetical protein GEV08_16735 [Acidimicrobiia bacterium]|nr:hypothetical protein [Acidimicrobiia bacterium]